MLGDLLWYAWHVKRFPYEDIVIGSKKVSELAFLFGRELGPNPHCLGWVDGVDPHHLSFFDWVEGSRGGWLVVVWDCRSRRFSKLRELS